MVGVALVAHPPLFGYDEVEVVVELDPEILFEVSRYQLLDGTDDRTTSPSVTAGS